MYIQHLATRSDFRNDYYICKAKVLVIENKYEEACKWWNLAYDYNNEEWNFITNQRLGAINGEYDLLNAELQNEKERVRMMRVYNMVLIALLIALVVALVIIKIYKRDLNKMELDVERKRERFNTLVEKYKSDYVMNKDSIMTDSMQNLEKLHEAYPSLTRTDISIVWLLFMNYPTTTICELLSISQNYFYQRKSIIYKTVNIKGKGSAKALEKIVKEYMTMK